MAKNIKILFTGGGSGGHVTPIIAVARELQRLEDYQNNQAPKNPATFYYIGPRDNASFSLLKNENFKTYGIVAGKIRRYFSFENFTDILFKIPVGFVQSFFLMLFVQPDLVFSKGGTGSAVVVFSAAMLGIPIFIHESDAVPGKSNQFASRFAKKIFISFEKTAYFNLNKTILVGNPIEKELTEGDSDSAKELFNLTMEKPVLLFLGGSQGAQPINDFVVDVLHNLLKSYEVIHSCGKKNYQQIRAETQAILDKDLQKYYHPYELLDEIHLKHALKIASVIISRAGSGAIFEIAAAGKPSILIPLSSAANDHQSKNAYEYAKTGGAIVVEEENLIPDFFIEKINYLISNADEMEKMKNAALQFSKPLAAKAVAREMLEFLHPNEI